MAFDTIRNNLNALEKDIRDDNKPISIDDLLESFRKLKIDAEEENELMSVQSFSIANNDDYVQNLYNVVSFIYEEYANNSSKLKELIANYGNYILDSEKKLHEMENQLKEEISTVESKRKIDEKLKKERGELLSLSEENEQLQKDIDILSDSHLDSIKEKNEQLREELQSKEGKEEELKSQNSTLTNNIIAVDNSISELEETRSSLESKKSEKEEKKKAIEESNTETEAWLSGFDDWYATVNEKVKNMYTQQTMMLNAWNSINNTIDTTVDNNGVLENINQNAKSYNDIKKWFETHGQEIDRLLEEYRIKLKTVIDTADKIAADKTEERNEN